MGGVEKGGGGEGESSVQLFNNWRNSKALENSLKEKTEQRKKKHGSDHESFHFDQTVGSVAGTPASPGLVLAFACFGVALRLDEGVNGSFQKLPAETAVQLGDGVGWRKIRRGNGSIRAQCTFLFKETNNVQNIQLLRYNCNIIKHVNVPA